MSSSKKPSQGRAEQPAYSDGKRYAHKHWACPCLRCLRAWFGYSEADAIRFRQGFFEAIVKVDLDFIARIDPANCELH